MTIIQAEEFTDEEMLERLRVLFKEYFYSKEKLLPSTGIVDFVFKKSRWYHIDFAIEEQLEDMFFGIAHNIGCEFSDEEFYEMFGFELYGDDEQLTRDHNPATFQSLIDLLKKKVKPVSLKPVTIAGSRCEAAGIFLGMKRIVDQINPKSHARIAPSTPLLGRINLKTMEVLENRLQWISGNYTPLFLRLWFSKFMGFLFCVVSLLLIGAGVSSVMLQINFFSGPVFIVALIVALAFVVIYHAKNPLPKDVVTFGDLARFLAAKKTLAGSP